MLPTIIISVIILALMGLALAKHIKDSRKGGCGCGCANCPEAKNCHTIR